MSSDEIILAKHDSKNDLLFQASCFSPFIRFSIVEFPTVERFVDKMKNFVIETHQKSTRISVFIWNFFRKRRSD